MDLEQAIYFNGDAKGQANNANGKACMLARIT
jgi:hypothetical protein